MTTKKDRMQQIGLAAMEQFSIHGYAATSVEDIAKAAGIGKGTIYDYYRAKEDMFIAAIKTWIDLQWQQISDQLVGLNDPEAKLNTLVHFFLDNCNLEDPTTAALSFEIVQQTLLPTGKLRDKRHLLKDMYTGQVRMVQGILLEGITQGRFRPEIAMDADRMAVNLLAFLDGIIWHTMIMGSYVDPHRSAQYYVQQMLNEIRMPGGDDSQRSMKEA